MFLEKLVSFRMESFRKNQLEKIFQKKPFRNDFLSQLGVSFDSSRATAAQAATVEHESDRP
jgi:hypothetical protein